MAKLKKKLTGAAKFADQISAEATLRFGPQENALRNRLSDAAAVRSQTRGGASSTARLIGTAADRGRSDVAGIVRPVQAAAEVRGQATGAAMAALPGGVDTLKAAVTAEGNSQRQRLADTLARAQTDLTTQKASAQSGAAFAKQQADQAYAGERSKVRGDAQALAGQEGAFAQGRLGQLLGEQTKLNHDSSQKGADRRSREQIAADDRQGAADRAATKAGAAADKAAAKKRAASVKARGKGEAGFQAEFDKGSALLAVSDRPSGEVDAKDKPIYVPFTPKYVAAHKEDVVLGLVAKGVKRAAAERAVIAYLQNEGKPGSSSFKDYGQPAPYQPGN